MAFNYVLDSNGNKVFPLQNVVLDNGVKAILVFEKLPSTCEHHYYFKIGCRQFVSVEYFKGTFKKLEKKMRKITLALLILLSTQAFAGKNLIEVYIMQNGKLVANQNNLNNGIPEKTALNEKYTVSYTYINQVAIPIQGFVPYFSEGFNAISNDCLNVLPVGGMCSITAEYTPSKLGKNDVYMYLREGGNLFYIPATTETYQYVGEPKIELSEESKPFNTYYSNPEMPNAVYVFKNVGSNKAVISSAMIDGKPTQLTYPVVNNCGGASLPPNGQCSIIFGGWLVAGVHNFKITIYYDGKQYVYSETVIVGDDKKVVGCRIG